MSNWSDGRTDFMQELSDFEQKIIVQTNHNCNTTALASAITILEEQVEHH